MKLFLRRNLLILVIIGIFIAAPVHAQNTADGTVQPGGSCTTDTNCNDVNGQDYVCTNSVCTLATTSSGSTTTPPATSGTPAAGGSVGSTINSTGFVPLTKLPAIITITTSNSLVAFFNVLYKILIGVAVILTVFQLVVAGFMYLTAGDNGNQVSSAKGKIQKALLGLLIVLSPVIIFSIINPSILSLKIATNTLQSTGSTAAPAASTPQNSCGNTPQATTLSGGQSCSDSIQGSSAVAASCCPNMSSGQTCCAGATATPGAGSSGLNIQAAVAYLDGQIQPPPGNGQCAVSVRLGLAAGGLTSFNSNHPAYAYQYGPYLTAAKFAPVSQSGYTPVVGDIIVFQPVPGGSTGGHIEMYDGSGWVSDVKNTSIYANPHYQGSTNYAIFRP